MRRQRVVVVGGGIVGLATAAHVASLGHGVVVLEKEDHWAAHQTGHNSGVIHAGPYYKPGSLKAQLCITGNKSMVRFAEDNGIAHDVCGKLIVAVDETELPALKVLHERAVANGASVALISGSEAREYEPNVNAVAALRVEDTGIIDYSAVSRALARHAELSGAELRLNSAVTDIRSVGGSVEVTAGDFTTTADLLINAAGLHSDRIAAMAGIKPQVRIVPFRGEYYELTDAKRALVRGLIYPVPDPNLPFLGVHLTRMIDGSVHAGPNAVFALAREGYSWSRLSVRDSLGAAMYPGLWKLGARNLRAGAAEVRRSLSRKVFAASLARLVSDIGVDDIRPAGAGVRAQAVLPDGRLADDFIIQHAANQVHVLNAPSPAATSSLEIAKYIARESGLTAVTPGSEQ